MKKKCDKLDKLDKQQNKTKQQKCVQLQRAANFFWFTPCLRMLGNKCLGIANNFKGPRDLGKYKISSDY